MCEVNVLMNFRELQQCSPIERGSRVTKGAWGGLWDPPSPEDTWNQGGREAALIEATCQDHEQSRRCRPCLQPELVGCQAVGRGGVGKQPLTKPASPRANALSSWLLASSQPWSVPTGVRLPEKSTRGDSRPTRTRAGAQKLQDTRFRSLDIGRPPTEGGDPLPLRRCSGVFNSHFLSTCNMRCWTLRQKRGKRSRRGDIHKSISLLFNMRNVRFS